MHTSRAFAIIIQLMITFIVHACVPTLQMDGAPSAVSIFKREIKPQIREVEDDISDGELSQRAEDMWLDLPSEQKVANTCTHIGLLHDTSV